LWRSSANRFPWLAVEVWLDTLLLKEAG